MAVFEIGYRHMCVAVGCVLPVTFHIACDINNNLFG